MILLPPSDVQTRKPWSSQLSTNAAISPISLCVPKKQQEAGVLLPHRNMIVKLWQSSNSVLSSQRLRLWSTLPTATGCQLGSIAKCKNLVTLTLHEVAVSKPMSLASLVPSWKHLEEVTISYEAYPASPWHITADNGLGFRDMFACPVWQIVDNPTVEELVRHCPVRTASVVKTRFANFSVTLWRSLMDCET